MRLEWVKKIMTCVTLAAFMASSVTPCHAQLAMPLPAPGALVGLTERYDPVLIKGIRVSPDDPLRMQFLVDQGEGNLDRTAKAERSKKLIRYFMAGLTIPEQDLWVNLSPVESDRIVPEKFGQTEMGRDLLGQDYVLKQLSASMLHPESAFGRKFWAKVYAAAQERYGTADIPTDAFNKIWVIPAKSVVYERDNTALVVESHLKVMLEADYLAADRHPERSEGSQHSLGRADEQVQKNTGILRPFGVQNDVQDVMREIVIPAIEKEVNEGQLFAPLRQIYQSLILAVWFKKKIKQHALNQAYTGQGKINGLQIADKDEAKKIYDRYVEAYRKGVVNMIREERDPGTDEIIARKYFTGGMNFIENVTPEFLVYPSSVPAEAAEHAGALESFDISFQEADDARVPVRRGQGFAGLVAASGLGDMLARMSGAEAAYSQMVRGIRDEPGTTGELYRRVMELDALVDGMVRDAQAFDADGLARVAIDRYIGRLNQVHAQNLMYLLIYLGSQPDFKKIASSKSLSQKATALVRSMPGQGALKTSEIFTPAAGDAAFKRFSVGINQDKALRLDHEFQKTIGLTVFDAMLGHDGALDDPFMRRLYQGAFEDVLLDAPNLDINDEIRAGLFAVLKADHRADLDEFLSKLAQEQVFEDLQRSVTERMRGLFIQDLGAFFDGYMPAADNAMASSGQAAEKLAAEVDRLAAEYYGNLSAITRRMEQTHDPLPATELVKLTKRLERSYKRIRSRLKFHVLRNSDDTLTSQAARAYLDDVAAAHNSAQRYLDVYTHVTWKRSEQESRAYRSLAGDVSNAWRVWELSAAGALSAEWKEEYRKLADIREQYELSDDPLVKPWLHGRFKEALVRGLKGVVATQAQRLVHHHFKAVLYASVIMDMQQKDPARALEFLKLMGLSGVQEGAAVKDGVRGVLQGYSPQEIQQKIRSLDDEVAAWMGRDVQKREVVRKAAAVGKWALYAAGALIVVFSIFNMVGAKSTKDIQAGEKASTEKAASSKTALPVKKEKIADILGRVRSVAAAMPGQAGYQKQINDLQKKEALQKIAALNTALQELTEKTKKDFDVVVKTGENFREKDERLQADKKLLQEYEKPAEEEFKEPEKWEKPGVSNEDMSGGKVGEWLAKLRGDIGLTAGDQEIPSDIGESQIEVGIGSFGPEAVAATSNAPARELMAQQHIRVAPFTGRMFAEKPDFRRIAEERMTGDFTIWVVMNPGRKKEFMPLVPPGYEIDNVFAENGSGNPYALYHDADNGAWKIVFEKKPGKVKFSIRKSDANSGARETVFVDDDGGPMSAAAFEAGMKERLPPAMWDVLIRARGLDSPRREEILQKLLGLFYYTTNPALAKAPTWLDAMFPYYAGHCQSMALIRIIMARLMNLPGGVVQTGFSGYRTYYLGLGHAWVGADGETYEPTMAMSGSSPYSQMQGVTPAMWDKEMREILADPVRAQWIAASLKVILADMEKTRLEAEKQDLESGIQQSQAPEAQQVFSFDEQNQRYFDLQGQYRQDLEAFDVGARSFEEKEEILRGIDPQDLEGAPDQYQLMALADFYFQLIELMEADTSFEPAHREILIRLKQELFLKVRSRKAQDGKFSENKGWDLMEPTPNVAGFHNDMSGFRLDLYHAGRGDTDDLYQDIYSGQRFTVPKGAVPRLLDNGTYGFESYMGKMYFFRGVRNDSMPRLSDNYTTVLNVEIPRNSLDENNWIMRKITVPVKTDGFDEFEGPMAERSGIAGKKYHYNTPYAVIDGDVLVVNNNTGRFEGGLAERMGLGAVHFSKASVPFRQLGREVYHLFYQDHGTGEIKRVVYDVMADEVEVVSMSSEAGWLDFYPESLIVSNDGGFSMKFKDAGGWGLYNSFSSDIEMSVRSTATEGGGRIQWVGSGSVFVLFKDTEGRYNFGGSWADRQENISTFRYGFAFQNGKNIFANQPVPLRNGIMKLSEISTRLEPIIIPLNKEGSRWVGTYADNIGDMETRPDHGTSYEVFGPNDVIRELEKKKGVFIDHEKPAYYLGDDWMVPVKFVHKSGKVLSAYDGPLVDKKFPAWSVASRTLDYERHGLEQIEIAFEKNEDGSVLPDRYLVLFTMKGGRGFTGTLADFVRQGSWKSSLDIIKDQEGRLCVLVDGELQTQQRTDFLNRMVARYGVVGVDDENNARIHAMIPSYRMDRRLEHIGRMLEMDPQSLAAQDAFIFIVQEMSKKGTAIYFDRHGFEKVFRRLYCSDMHDIELFHSLRVVLQTWGFEHLLVEALLAGDDRSNYYAKQVIKPFLWSRAIKAYFNNQKKTLGLPSETVSPQGILSEEELGQAEELNRLYLEFSGNTALKDSLEEFDRQVRSVMRDLTGQLSQDILNASGAQAMTDIMASLHDLVGVDMPFDVEVSAEVRKGPVYKFLQHVYRQEWPWLKVGAGHYSERYAKWQEVNARLNAILGKDHEGGRDISVLKEFIGETAHDGPTLFLLLMAMIYLSNFALRKGKVRDLEPWKDGADDVMRKLWVNNPFFDGDSEGGLESARDFLKGIMSLRRELSTDEQDKLAAMRRSLPEDRKLVFDALTLIASERPDQETAVGQRLFGFIPVFGATLMRQRPNTKKWQAFNVALLDWARGISAGQDLKSQYAGLEDILRQYADFNKLEMDNDARTSMPDVDEFRGLLRAAFYQDGSVIVKGRLQKTSGPNGTSLKQRGPSSYLAEVGVYQEGDRINYPSSARTGVLMGNKTEREALLPASMVINMSGITRENMVPWLDELADSLKALDPRFRKGPDRSGQWLGALLFVMPDGTVETVTEGFRDQQAHFEHVRAQVTAHVMKYYMKVHGEDHDGRLRQMADALTGLPFLEPAKNERYVQRVKETLKKPDGLRGARGKLRQHLPVLLRQGTVYTVGFDEQERNILAKAFPAATGLWFRSHQAFEIRPGKDHAESVRDHGQAPDKLGGVDLRAVADMTQLMGDPASGELTAQVMHLRNMKGLMPVIIDVQAVDQVEDFLVPATRRQS